MVFITSLQQCRSNGSVSQQKPTTECCTTCIFLFQTVFILWSFFVWTQACFTRFSKICSDSLHTNSKRFEGSDSLVAFGIFLPSSVDNVLLWFCPLVLQDYIGQNVLLIMFFCYCFFSIQRWREYFTYYKYSSYPVGYQPRRIKVKNMRNKRNWIWEGWKKNWKPGQLDFRLFSRFSTFTLGNSIQAVILENFIYIFLIL